MFAWFDAEHNVFVSQDGRDGVYYIELSETDRIRYEYPTHHRPKELCLGEQYLV